MVCTLDRKKEITVEKKRAEGKIPAVMDSFHGRNLMA
jgi:hypothetical protein